MALRATKARMSRRKINVITTTATRLFFHIIRENLGFTSTGLGLDSISSRTTGVPALAGDTADVVVMGAVVVGLCVAELVMGWVVALLTLLGLNECDSGPLTGLLGFLLGLTAGRW